MPHIFFPQSINLSFPLPLKKAIKNISNEETHVMTPPVRYFSQSLILYNLIIAIYTYSKTSSITVIPLDAICLFLPSSLPKEILPIILLSQYGSIYPIALISHLGLGLIFHATSLNRHSPYLTYSIRGFLRTGILNSPHLMAFPLTGQQSQPQTHRSSQSPTHKRMSPHSDLHMSPQEIEFINNALKKFNTSKIPPSSSPSPSPQPTIHPSKIQKKTTKQVAKPINWSSLTSQILPRKNKNKAISSLIPLYKDLIQKELYDILLPLKEEDILPDYRNDALNHIQDTWDQFGIRIQIYMNIMKIFIKNNQATEFFIMAQSNFFLTFMGLRSCANIPNAGFEYFSFKKYFPAIQNILKECENTPNCPRNLLEANQQTDHNTGEFLGIQFLHQRMQHIIQLPYKQILQELQQNHTLDFHQQNDLILGLCFGIPRANFIPYILRKLSSSRTQTISIGNSIYPPEAFLGDIVWRSQEDPLALNISERRATFFALFIEYFNDLLPPFEKEALLSRYQESKKQLEKERREKLIKKTKEALHKEFKQKKSLQQIFFSTAPKNTFTGFYNPGSYFLHIGRYLTEINAQKAFFKITKGRTISEIAPFITTLLMRSFLTNRPVNLRPFWKNHYNHDPFTRSRKHALPSSSNALHSA